MNRKNRAPRTARTTVAAVAATLALGATALSCPDTNGDDVVDVQDLTNVILDWGGDGSGNNGDVNDDGTVDVQDLTEVILSWGPFECPSEECVVEPGAPDNDCCATATVVNSNVSLAYDTTNANTDGPDDVTNPCNSTGDDSQLWKDIWYRYTAPESGILTVGNCNQAVPFDTKLIAYAVGEGECDPGALIASTIECNEDCATDVTSELTFAVEAGETILLRLGGFSADAMEDTAEFGAGTMTFDLLTDNDQCVLATEIAAGETIEDTTADADVDESAANCGGGVPDAPGRWYKTVGDGTTYTVALCQTGFKFDTRLSVYCGQPFGEPCDGLTCAFTEPNNNCGGAGLFNETATFCTADGTTYYILVHGFAGASGDYILEVSSDGAPGCVDPACPPAMGACCIGADCIGETTSDECYGQEGNWLEEMTCGAVNCGTLPANDGYFGAIDLGTGNQTIEFDNTNALAAGPDGAPFVVCNPFGDSPGILNDLWYVYTASIDGTVQIDTCNPDDPNALDTKLAIYNDTGFPPDPLTDIACVDDDDNDGDGICTTPPGNQSAVLLPVTTGQTILIRVGAWGTDASPGSDLGASVLSVQEVEP